MQDAKETAKDLISGNMTGLPVTPDPKAVEVGEMGVVKELADRQLK